MSMCSFYPFLLPTDWEADMMAGATAANFSPLIGATGEGKGDPLQYSCLGNPKDRGAPWTTVRRVAKSDMT